MNSNLEQNVLDENESVIQTMIEQMNVRDIKSASDEINSIIDTLIPPNSRGIYDCEDDIWEIQRLQGFALRLLTKKSAA